MAKPLLRCSVGSRSPTNARNGSIVTLTLASRIHSNPAAIQTVPEFGMAISARLARIAPIRK